MTDLIKSKSVHTSSDVQSNDAARKTGNHANDAAGVLLHNQSVVPDVSMLGAPQFAAFDEAWNAHAEQIDDIAAEDGGVTAQSLLLPAVQAAREAAEDAFDFARDIDGLAASGENLFADPDQSAEKSASGAVVVADEQFVTADAATTSGAGKFVAPPDPVAANVIVGDDGGSDWLEGTNQNDDIYGLAGNDVLFGHRGNDNLFGGEGSDWVFGGRGHDKLWGAQNADYLDGGRGNDKIFAGSGGDALIGREGDDELYGEGGNDVLSGGAGNDLFDGGAGIDTASFAGSDGAVNVALWLNSPQWTGEGLDTFVDIENLFGSQFHDVLSGDSGNNRLEGRDGHDRLDGGPGNDYLAGGDGSDGLIGGTGNDIFDGGEGNDYAVFSGSAVGVVVDLGWNGPQNTGQGIDSFLSVESVYGSILGDLLRGTNGDNNIGGDDGNDWLWGVGGNDELFGGDGNDVLHGGAGTDGLSGDGGVDAFVYGAFFGDAGDDYISDFEDGVEKVFVEIGFGISDFSDVTVSTNFNGDAVAHFNGVFGGSITFSGLAAEQIGQDDFIFFA